MNTKLHSLLLIMSVFCIAGFARAETAAQKLAGFAPDDSVFYLAGCGTDKLEDEFNQTLMHDLINDPSVKTFVDQVKAAIMPKVSGEGDFIEGLQFVKDIVRQTKILKDPVLAGAVVHKLDPKEGDFEGYGYLVTTGGTAKVETFKSTILSVFEKYKKMDQVDVQTVKVYSVGDVVKFTKPDKAGDSGSHPAICLANVNNYMILVVTAQGQEDTYLQKLARNIKAGPKSIKAFEGTEFTGDDIIAGLSYEHYFNMIEHMIQSGEDDVNPLMDMFESMNLKELGIINYRIGFEGEQVVLDFYGDRLGSSMFADFYSIIDKKMLKAVPFDATGFTLFDYNLEKIFYMYRDMIGAIDQNAISEIDKAFYEFQDELGVNLEDGLLDNISGEMLLSFKANEAAGMIGGSFSCLMSVNDADLLTAAIDQLVDFAKKKMESSPLPVNYNITEQDGKKLRTIAIPQLAMFGFQPTIIKLDDKHIVLSSSTKSAIETSDLWHADNLAKSILSNPKYQNAVADAPDDLYILQYTDAEVFLNSMCTTMNTYWPMITMVAGQKDIVLPPMLPQVNHLFEDMPPSVMWSSTDGETGIRTKIKTDGVALSAISTAYAGFIGAVVTPAISKSKSQAQVAICMNNLKQIGLALHTYNSEKGTYPETLEGLGDYLGKPLKCPQHDKGYVYRGNDLPTDAGSQMIMAYCPDHSNSNTVIFLCYDGHVEKICPAGFKGKIENDNKLRADLGLSTKPAIGIKGIKCDPETEDAALPEF